MIRNMTLTLGDLENFVHWFELAFASNNNQSNSDKRTLAKLYAIAFKAVHQ